MTGIGFFSDEEFHAAVQRNFPHEGERYSINAGNLTIPVMRQKILLPSGEFSVTRLGTAGVTDYFSFPGYERLENQAQAENIIQQTNTDVILFSNIVVGSKAYNAFHGATQGDWLPASSSFGVQCGDGFDGYLRRLSRVQRRTVRRKLKVATENGFFSIRKCTERDINWVLAAQSLRSRIKQYTSLKDRREFVQFLLDLTRNTHVLFAAYTIAGKVASGLILFEEKKCWSVYVQGFDEKYAALSPSYSTINWTIQEACSQGIPYVDLLRGNEPYKAHIAKNEVQMRKFFLKENTQLQGIDEFVKGWEE